MKYTIQLDDEQQYLRLLQLAQALGMGATIPVTPMSDEERQHHLRIVAKGGSGVSITDPVTWQREVRADRPLPGRD
ncbi:hypothetical protein [Hymenobacter siberiensis]|uniref:hypothetical protein n=1 Tax=Hymenobacter siberiensis TaxID=2848396 RepID=UPI001C1E4F22|nr:hypothetical protein [Hymenobacter siberiensis]